MKVENKNRLKKASKTAGIIIVTAIITLTIYGVFLQDSSKGCLYYPRNYLSVDATYLLKVEESDDFVNVICTPYITNNKDKASGTISIIAYVIDTSNNIALSKTSFDVGNIRSKTTSEVVIRLICWFLKMKN